MTVRPVRPDDEADLAVPPDLRGRLRDTPDHEPLSYERWRARIGDLTAWDEWFVAEVDGVPVGALQSSDQALDQQSGWVKNLSVLPAYRRRGVGAALLRRAFARYAAKGRQAAGLGVDLTNPTAPLSLYRSVGLRETQLDRHVRTCRSGGRCVIDDPGPARPALRSTAVADWGRAIRAATPTRCRWGGPAAR